MDYSTNDPKGWGGDPRRGAALGRPTIKGVPHGTIRVQRSPLDRQGYDRNGTYFGSGSPLYWISDEGGEVDFVERSTEVEDLLRDLRDRYPGNEVVLGEPLSLPCWGHGEEFCPDKADAEEEYGDQCAECYAEECRE